MAIDDIFGTPEVDVDLFGGEVEALVVSAYKAALDGIDRLDRQQRPRPDLAANPEEQVEIDLWDQQISAMKYHAGNMGLVTIFTLFDDWLAKKHKAVLPREKTKGGPVGLFSRLEKKLQVGSVSLARLTEIKDARDSIIHHRGNPEFEFPRGNFINVKDQFLSFDEASGEERVAIEESVLMEVTAELTSHVKKWGGVKVR